MDRALFCVLTGGCRLRLFVVRRGRGGGRGLQHVRFLSSRVAKNIVGAIFFCVGLFFFVYSTCTAVVLAYLNDTRRISREREFFLFLRLFGSFELLPFIVNLFNAA